MRNNATQKAIAAIILIAASHEAQIQESKAKYIELAYEAMRGLA